MFKLNENRDGFVLNSPDLQYKVLNIGDSMDEILFGSGFGCITDVVAGPDGLLYIVSHSDGTIYRIIPKIMSDKENVGAIDPPSTNDSFTAGNAFIIYIAGAIVIGIILFVIIRHFYKNRSK